MPLPDYIPRCTGAGCHLRTNCQRYLDESYLDESYQGERNLIAPAVIQPEVLCGRTGQQCSNQIPLTNDKKD